MVSSIFTWSGRPAASPLPPAVPGVLYGSILCVVLGAALLAGYLLLRDVHRETETAEMRSHFVASVSHELKTPLTSIRAHAETLLMGRAGSAETTADYLKTIVSESERLTRLVDSVLEFSRIEQGRKTYHLQDTRLDDVVRSAAKTMEYPLSQLGFTLTISSDGSAPTLRADPEALTQAILNLLGNAMKYSGDARSIEMRIGTRDGEAFVDVVDHGIGIARDDQARIFERFHRVQSVETAGIAGTGLGLPLALHVVEAHRGRIAVVSHPGRGSTFSVRIPLAGTGMTKVLVVEDDPGILRTVADNLRFEQYEVVTATDGETAYVLHQNEQPDLIVLDLMLPRMSGLELCRKLRTEDVQVPVLMLTARSEEADRVRGLDLGGDDYVTKPFSVPELMARVRALLRRASSASGVPDTLKFGQVEVDFRRYAAHRRGRPVEMTRKEFALLRFLASREDTVVTRDEILNKVWGFESYPITERSTITSPACAPSWKRIRRVPSTFRRFTGSGTSSFPTKRTNERRSGIARLGRSAHAGRVHRPGRAECTGAVPARPRAGTRQRRSEASHRAVRAGGADGGQGSRVGGEGADTHGRLPGEAGSGRGSGERVCRGGARVSGATRGGRHRAGTVDGVAPGNARRCRPGSLRQSERRVVVVTRPFVESYCANCHNARNRAGGLDLDSLSRRDCQ